MSKIYEALRKAEVEREQARASRPSGIPAAALSARAESANAAPTADDEFQRLRANLLTALGPGSMRTILVTAPRHHEGTTTVALGLARTLASERDARVLLVEGNLRSPRLARLLAMSENGGLARFLQGDERGSTTVNRVAEHNLSVILAGKPVPGASQVFDFELLGDLFARIRPDFDFVVIDGPPVNQYADTSILGSKVDGVILVVEADRTPVAEAEAAKRQLERVGARILGVVLNRKRSYIPAFIESIL